MIELTKVAPLQNQAEIRVGDEITRSGDNIGVALLSNVNVLDNFPNVFEVYLSLKDTKDLSGEALDGA